MSKKLSQAEIDELIQKMVSGEISPEEMEAAMAEESGGGAVAAAAEAPSPVTAGPDPNLDLGPITQVEVDAALRAAGKESVISQAASPSPGLGMAPAPVAAAPAANPPAAVTAFQPAAPMATPPAPQGVFVPSTPATQILMELELTMTAELVRTKMRLNQLLQLQPGSVLELNRKANEPVDLMVGGRQVMKAKVVTIGEHYGVQITESKVQRIIA